MPDARIGSEWVSGALRFFEKSSRTVVALLDPDNLKIKASNGFVEASEAATTAATLVNYGLSQITIATSSAGTKAFTLAAPIAGVTKYVHCATASTGGLSTLAAGSGTFNSTGATATFSSEGTLALVGYSTARWDVIAASTSITIT